MPVIIIIRVVLCRRRPTRRPTISESVQLSGFSDNLEGKPERNFETITNCRLKGLSRAGAAEFSKVGYDAVPLAMISIPLRARNLSLFCWENFVSRFTKKA